MSRQKTLETKKKKIDKRKVRTIKSSKKSGRIPKEKIKKAVTNVAEKRRTKKQPTKDVGKVNLKIKKPSGKKSKSNLKQPNKKINQKKTRKKVKQNNVLNLGKIIRDNTKFKVSPLFVDEIKSRIIDQLEEDIYESNKLAKAEGMKTLQEHHAIRIYDYNKSDNSKMLTCEKCGNSFVIPSEKADKKNRLTCPFCKQKRYLNYE